MQNNAVKIPGKALSIALGRAGDLGMPGAVEALRCNQGRWEEKKRGSEKQAEKSIHCGVPIEQEY
jgi:hypothetical protein